MVCLNMGACVEVKGQLWGPCALPLPWVLGTKHRLLGLHSKCFYLLNHLALIKNCFKIY